MKNKIDAVKMIREIRDKMHERTKKLSRSQLIHFYQERAQLAHARLKARSKAVAA